MRELCNIIFLLPIDSKLPVSLSCDGYPGDIASVQVGINTTKSDFTSFRGIRISVVKK